MNEAAAPKAVGPLDRLRAVAPYLVVLGVGLFLYYKAETIEFEQTSGRIGPGAWPKMILALLLASAIWGIVTSYLQAGRAKPARDAEEEELEAMVRPPEIHPGRVWIAIGATILYLIAMPLLGFFLATLVYTTGLMVLGDFRRPLALGALSLGVAFFFLFVFMRVVYVALPLGVAPFDRVSIALMSLIGVR